jgi:hypothetical protein
MKKRPSPNGKKSRSRVFNVRLDEQVFEDMRTLAQLERRTMTNMVQVLVAEGVMRRGVAGNE